MNPEPVIIRMIPVVTSSPKLMWMVVKMLKFDAVSSSISMVSWYQKTVKKTFLRSSVDGSRYLFMWTLIWNRLMAWRITEVLLTIQEKNRSVDFNQVFITFKYYVVLIMLLHRYYDWSMLLDYWWILWY